MLTKYAASEVIEARVARKGRPLMKSAHRVNFDYEPRPGFLYVRSRAISSRTNDNYDHFPAEEIKKAYSTFIGKPVFVNHHNDDHRRARGVIVDAALHEDVNPDGSPDTWVEVLMEIDAVKFPKLAQAILAGHIDRTSMGTDVEYSLCSVCGNKAYTPLEYCKHIPAMKGLKVQRTTASGEKEEVLVYEKCYGLRFFENSLLVEEPADPTAFFLGVDDRGLAMTSRKAGFPAPRRADLQTGDPVTAANKRVLTAVRKTASRKRGYGEVKAPTDVDTLRDEACPVCGETESFNGDTCQVCGYMRPPDMFLDPDLEKAQQIDLRQQGDQPTTMTDFEQVEQNDLMSEPQAFTEDGLESVEEQEAGEEPPFPESAEEDAEADTPPADVLNQPEDVSDEGEGADDEVPGDEEPRAQITDEGDEGLGESEINQEFEELAEGSAPENNGSEEKAEDESEEDEDEFPFDKKSRLGSRGGQGGSPKMIRKLIQAVNGQARTIRSQGRRIRELESALRFVVTAAGLQQHPRVAVLWKRSQDENPANAGWAVDEDVAAEAPETTSEEALGDVNNEAPEGGSGLDDVTAPGSTSETDVAADAQTDLSSTEVVLDTPAYSEDQDVTSPVAGTEDLGEGPAGEAGSGRTESEVVVGTPADDSPAFAIEEGGWETEARRGEARTLAALRLARLRIQAGIEGGDDLDIAGRINHSKMSDRDIQHEIDVLAKVVKAGSNGQAKQARTRVPRLSSRRVAPSMQEEPVIPIQTIASGPSDDEFLWE